MLTNARSTAAASVENAKHTTGPRSAGCAVCIPNSLRQLLRADSTSRRSGLHAIDWSNSGAAASSDDRFFTRAVAPLPESGGAGLNFTGLLRRRQNWPAAVRQPDRNSEFLRQKVGWVILDVRENLFITVFIRLHVL